MTIFKISCLFVAVCVLSSLSSANVSAGGPYGGYLSCGDYGHRLRRAANQYALPYFALHPPVYYSHVVPRPYGYSPFALPPGVQPAEAVQAAPEAQEIVNPYYKPKKESKPLDRTAARQQRPIENPFFVKRPAEPSADKLAEK